MKKFLLFVILFNVFKGAYSQTNTFTGSGTWDTNARWSLGVPPTAAQDAVINGAVTNIATTGNVCKTLTINGSFSISGTSRQITVSGDVTIGNSATVSITGANNYYIAYTGSSFLVASSATLTMTASGEGGIRYTGTGNSTITNGSASNFGSINVTNSGTLTTASNITMGKNIIVGATGTFKIASGNTVTMLSTSGATTVTSGGKIIVEGTLVNQSTTNLSLAGTGAITVNATGSYVHHTNGAIGAVFGSFTLNTYSTFIYRGSSTLVTPHSFNGKTYYNLIMESTSGVYLPDPSGSNDLTVLGNLSIGGSGAGTVSFNLNSSSPFTGNINVAGATTIVSGNSYTTSSSSILTTDGDITINGTLTMLSDVTVGGNWIVGASGTQTNNSKAVFFNGTGTQTITKSSGGTVFFDYLVQNKASGSIVIDNGTNVTINSTSGAVLQMNNAGQLDLNGQTLTLNNSGGNIQVNTAARNIISSISGGVFAITNSKTVTNSAGSGSLVFGNNVTVLLTGSFNPGAGLTTMGAGSTLQLNANGSVITNTPSYHCSSLLKYNTNVSGQKRGQEWTSSAVPGNVQISNSTTMDGDNVGVSGNQSATICGSLTIDANSFLHMNYGSGSGALTVSGAVLVNGTLTAGGASGGDVTLGGDLTIAAVGVFNSNGRAIIFNGSTGAQTITRVGSGVVTFDYLHINKSSGNVVLSNSPATTVGLLDHTFETNTLQLKNGNLDLNGQTINIYAYNGSTVCPAGSPGYRNGILVQNGSRTITSSTAATINILGTFTCGFAGMVVNATTNATDKLIVDANVTINTKVGFAPTDNTIILGTLQLNTYGATVAGYGAVIPSGYVADLNQSVGYGNSGENGHPIYGVGATLVYNNAEGPASSNGTGFDRNKEWDAVGVGTVGVTPGYPYNVIVKNNTTLNIGVNTTGGIDDRAIANDLTIQSGSTLDMNVMDETGDHLSIGNNITITGTLKLGHGSTTDNPYVGDILVNGNWVRAGSSSVFDANETGTGYSAANTQTIISDKTSNITARAVTFTGATASSITAPFVATRDINGGFGGETFPYLKINKTNNTNTVTNTAPITITRQLNLIKGTLNVGDSNIVIASNLYRTADIAAITSPADIVINYPANGRFVVQRFIYNESTLRSWRFLTAPLQATDLLTINDAWQEGVVNPVKTNPSSYDPWPSVTANWCGLTSRPGFGTHITGPGGVYNSANGFDEGSNSFSIQYLDNSGSTNAWVCPANTKSVKLMSKLAWGLFVRGDRSFLIDNQFTPATATVILEPRGKINVGDVTSTVVAGKTNLIGNPYAAQINMTNVSIGGATKQNFKLWDPKAFVNYAATGKYIPFSWVSGTTYAAANSPVTTWTNPGTVEAGEGFFATPSTGTVVFHESDKVAEKSTLQGIQSRPSLRPVEEVVSFFRSDLAYYNAVTSAYTLIDGTLCLYNPAYKNAVDENEDVVSPLSKSAMGAIRISKGETQLAIEKQGNIIKEDTLFLYLSKLRQERHQLIFSSTDFPKDIKASLVDNYLNKTTVLGLNNTDSTFIVFDITNDPYSNSYDRFKVIFQKPLSTTLPVNFTLLTANLQQNNSISINWQVSSEVNIKKYVIERSIDGQHFSMLTTLPVAANNNGMYNWEDKTTVTSTYNYYRIATVDQTGAIQYSTIIKTKTGEALAAFKLRYTPIINGVVELQMNNLPKGIYQFNLFNTIGQTILSKEINISAEVTMGSLLIGTIRAKGIYQLEIIKPNNTKSTLPLVY